MNVPDSSLTPHLVGLVGAGVGPSLTPRLHMAEARALGVPYVYRTLDLDRIGASPDDIGAVLRTARAYGYDALNVTHPCKQRVLAHLDRVDPVAEALGAVNTVLFTETGAVGHNTDTTGFATAFSTGLAGVRLDRVVLLGAGGAGAAVADAMLRLGTEHLVVVDVDADRAAALTRSLSERHAESRVDAATPDKLSVLVPAADGLVHCTPTGMADHPGLPLDADLLDAHHWVADIVYRPLETALLAAARAAGCRVLDGGRMAVHQAVDAFALVTGLTPDPDRMLAHFRTMTQEN